MRVLAGVVGLAKWCRRKWGQVRRGGGRLGRRTLKSFCVFEHLAAVNHPDVIWPAHGLPAWQGMWVSGGPCAKQGGWCAARPPRWCLGILVRGQSHGSVRPAAGRAGRGRVVREGGEGWAVRGRVEEKQQLGRGRRLSPAGHMVMRVALASRTTTPSGKSCSKVTASANKNLTL